MIGIAMLKLVILILSVSLLVATPVAAATHHDETVDSMEDAFIDNRYHWLVGIADKGFFKIQDGAYHQYITDDTAYYTGPNVRLDENVSVEVDFFMPDLIEDQDWSVSIGLRATSRDDNAQFTTCQISPPRSWSFTKFTKTREWELLDYGLLPAVVNTTQSNHLQCTVRGDEYVITLNGKEVGRMIDPDYTPSVDPLYPLLIGSNQGNHLLHIEYRKFKAAVIDATTRKPTQRAPFPPDDFRHP